MNPFHVRELNGEMRQDWGPTAGLVRNLQPASVLGGPFAHRFRTNDVGLTRCAVCGLKRDGSVVQPGCPVGVNMATLKDIKRPFVPGQVEANIAALREIWAAEKARAEEAV